MLWAPSPICPPTACLLPCALSNRLRTVAKLEVGQTAHSQLMLALSPKRIQLYMRVLHFLRYTRKLAVFPVDRCLIRLSLQLVPVVVTEPKSVSLFFLSFVNTFTRMLAHSLTLHFVLSRCILVGHACNRSIIYRSFPLCTNKQESKGKSLSEFASIQLIRSHL